jgi:hypothetical protein
MVFSFVALAQTATLNGTVTDQTGAAVPGVTVVAHMADTNTEREAQTSESGFYSLPTLTPGVYDVQFRKGGFRIVQITTVTLTVAQALTLDTKLELSAKTETVTVQGDTIAPIDTTDAQVSTVIDQKQIEDLPLVLRDPYQLVLLSPGSTYTNTGTGGFSIDGARDRNNNFQLDGTNNNDPGVPGSGLLTLNPDSTQEFRIISSNYLPEFGRNSGSVIDIITKSGTNDFHGDAYYFGRWDALGARDFFDPIGLPKAPYERNTFGASLGGPIVKNKVFFFVNYEGNRFNTSAESVADVPTAAYKTGIFTTTDSNGHPVNIDVSTPGSANNQFGLALDPQIQKVLNFYPTNATGPQVIPGMVQELFFNNPDIFSADNYIGKVDFIINSKNSLNFRYIFGKASDDNEAFLNVLPGLGGVAFKGQSQSLNGHLVSVIRPNLSNDLYGTANRTSANFVCPGVQQIDALSLAGLDTFGRGRDWALPGLTPIACVPLGDSDGQDRPFGTYGVGDNLTWTRGRHTMKFGGEFAPNYTNDFDNFSTRSLPNFSIFSSQGDFSALKNTTGPITNPTVQDMIWGLLGSVNAESQSQFYNLAGQSVSGDGRGFRERDFYLFAQDQWKIASNFTFSFGLRYEYAGVPWVVGNEITSATPAELSGPAPIVFNTVTRGGANPLYANDPWGFEPRIGFAWDPLKTGKTSIRGGYGLFRDRNFFNIVGDTRDNPPFTNLFTNNAFTDLGPVAADQISNIPLPVPGPAPSNTLVFQQLAFPATIDPNFHVAIVQQWNLGIQREIPHGMIVEVNYVGNKANRLPRVQDGNAPNPLLVSQLRAFCEQPNVFQCVNTPTDSTVQGELLYVGADANVINIKTGLPFLPFNAVQNSAAGHSNLVTSHATSNYNALQSSIRRQFANGISFQASYTWAHAIDDASDPFLPQVGNTVFPPNSFFLGREYGNSSFDVRNRFVFNYSWLFPIGRGTNHLNSGLIGRVLEGWQWSGIVTLQSGFPYEIFAPGDDSDGTGATQRASFATNPTFVPFEPGSPITGPNVGLFMPPFFGGPGNVPRNHFYGPSYKNFDTVLSKTTRFTERLSLEFRAEAYNFFNHPNFGQPDNNINDVGFFGESFSEVGRNDGTTGARQFQFGLKLHF